MCVWIGGDVLIGHNAVIHSYAEIENCVRIADDKKVKRGVVVRKNIVE
jgi:carbonic anhydrase/acetyltransferase-like protein (isoleucine patch superfamily)